VLLSAGKHLRQISALTGWTFAQIMATQG